MALCGYDWPGNVRELEHVISRAALRAVSRGADRNDILTLEPELLLLENVDRASVHAPGKLEFGGSDQEQKSSSHETLSMRQATELFQRQLIQRELARFQGNWAKVSRSLRIDTSNLHKLAKRLGVKDE